MAKVSALVINQWAIPPRLTPLEIAKQANWIFGVIENEIYTSKQTIFEPQEKQERRERERER